MPSPTSAPGTPVRAGLVGIGKMGVSHLAIANAHPGIDLVAVCDSQGFLLSGLRSQIEIATFKSVDRMLAEADLDAVFVATPTSSHVAVADEALAAGLHVFVEKPLTLRSSESRRLATTADAKGLVNQVGYHNRFIGTFRETARLVAAGAIGEVHHIDGRAFGPVVTSPKGGGRTWRAQKSEGGGCLHDYACHVIDLMNFVHGRPEEVMGAQLSQVHSTAVEDAVYGIFRYPGGAVGTLETNWSDDAHRKMTTSVTIYGTAGKIHADRQECRLYLAPGQRFETFEEGWTIRYITELQDPVDFYLRGEEYSSQMDAFVGAISGAGAAGACTFSEAADADWVVGEIERVHAEGRPIHDRGPGVDTVAVRARALAGRAAERFGALVDTARATWKERRR